VVGHGTGSARAFKAFVTGCGALLRSADPALFRRGAGWLRDAVEADTSYAAAWVKLGEAERAAYDADRTTEHLDRSWAAVNAALRQDSTRVDAYELASILCVQTGRSKEAVEFLRRAHQLEPRNTRVLERLAFNSVREKRFDEAERYYQLARDAAPDYSPVHAGLGWLYGRRGVPTSWRRPAGPSSSPPTFTRSIVGLPLRARRVHPRARVLKRAFTLRRTAPTAAISGLVTYLDGRFEEAVRYYEYVIGAAIRRAWTLGQSGGVALDGEAAR
jgi:tetratricopeptide (TPR) repeat protein